MRKSLGGIAITSLLLSFAPLTAHAATPKPGSLCPKLNQTQISNGVKYSCVKSGKKLVWNKGVAIAKPAPAPVVIPSAQPTQAAQPTPISKPVIPLAPQVTVDFVAPTTKKPNSIEELDAKTAWYFAWQSMQKYREAGSDYKPNYLIVSSSNFGSQKTQIIVDGLDSAAKFWSNFWRPDTKVTVILGTEKDLDFWKVELAKFYDPRFQQSPNDNYNYLVEDFSRSGAKNNSAGASWFTNKPNMNFPLGTEVTAEAISQNSLQTGPHEYTHLVQGTLGYAFNLPGIGPFWMNEGQAEHAGLFLSRNTPQDYLTYRNFRFINQWKNPQQENLRTSEDIYNAIKSGSANSVYSAYYSYGAAAWEALVAIYGQDSVVEYFKQIKNGANWDLAFKSVFGMAEDEYLHRVSVYLSKLRNQLLP